MSDDDYDANVVPFPRGQFERSQNARDATLDELAIRTQREPRSCAHTRSWVDEAARKLKCRDCEVDLDPIDVLATLACRREQLVHHGMRLRSEVEHLSERVEELKREERNAKSRIRNARRSRDDADALRAAAQAGVSIDGYRQWAELSEPQRGVVLDKVRRVIEAYIEAYERPDAEAEIA